MQQASVSLARHPAVPAASPHGAALRRPPQTPAPPALLTQVLEDARLQGCVVRLRGLPYSASASDVAAFFSGVQLADGDDAIVFTHTVDGRPTGEAYVELADEAAQAAAMTKHKVRHRGATQRAAQCARHARATAACTRARARALSWAAAARC